MADTKRQRIEKRIRNIVARGKKKGTPQANIDRETKLYRTQLAKLPTRVSPAPGKPKPIIKPKEKSKNKESKGFSFFTPKGRKQLDSIISKVMKAIGPDKKPTTQDVKKALPTNQNDMSNKSIEEIRNIIKKAEGEGNKLQAKLRQNKGRAGQKLPLKVKKKTIDQEGGVGQGLPLKAKKKTIDQEGGVAQGLPLKVKKKVPDYTPKGNKAMLKKKDSDSKFVKRIAKAIGTPAKKSIKNMKTINDRDTLSGIASKYGTTVKKLMELNSDTIKDPDKIYAGRKINVGAVPSTALGATNKDKPVLGGRGKITRKKGGTVFRRGGGQALRGFGKATYSNKMY